MSQVMAFSLSQKFYCVAQNQTLTQYCCLSSNIDKWRRLLLELFITLCSKIERQKAKFQTKLGSYLSVLPQMHFITTTIQFLTTA